MRSRRSKSKPTLVIAKHSGFCFGVRRAIELAHKALAHGGQVYSYGPIIHNAQAVGELKGKGLKVVRDVSRVKSGTLIVPSHGIDPRLVKGLKERKVTIVDATCPKVINSQRLARTLSDKGYTLIIVGDKDHPEVRSLRGFARSSVVIEDVAAAARYAPKTGKAGIIVQTTQSERNFSDILSELVKKHFEKVEIVNTLCKDTLRRQKEAGDLAHKCDCMIVVGGKESANTKRLSEICKKYTRTCHIETRHELGSKPLAGSKRIGIVSGTSTPDKIIRDVVKAVNTML